jgi:hypothetical protein
VKEFHVWATGNKIEILDPRVGAMSHGVIYKGPKYKNTILFLRSKREILLYKGPKYKKYGNLDLD